MVRNVINNCECVDTLLSLSCKTFQVSLYFRGKLWHEGSFFFCLSSMEQMVDALLFIATWNKKAIIFLVPVWFCVFTGGIKKAQKTMFD